MDANDAQYYANAYFALAATESPGSSDVYTFLTTDGSLWSEERFAVAESAFYQSSAYAHFLSTLDLASTFTSNSADVARRKTLRNLRANVWDKTQGICWYCETPTNPFRDFTIDHVIPVALGGSDDLANLVPCCRSCNSSKGAR